MLADGLRDRHEDHAGLLQLLLERGRDRNGVEHGIDGDAIARSTLLAILVHDAEQCLALAQWNAEFLVGL